MSGRERGAGGRQKRGDGVGVAGVRCIEKGGRSCAPRAAGAGGAAWAAAGRISRSRAYSPVAATNSWGGRCEERRSGRSRTRSMDCPTALHARTYAHTHARAQRASEREIDTRRARNGLALALAGIADESSSSVYRPRALTAIKRHPSGAVSPALVPRGQGSLTLSPLRPVSPGPRAGSNWSRTAAFAQSPSWRYGTATDGRPGVVVTSMASRNAAGPSSTAACK